MRHLYNYVKRNKSAVNEKFILKNQRGELISDDDGIKQKLREQWDKIYATQHWPNANMRGIPDDLKVSQENAQEMIQDFTTDEINVAIKNLHPGTSTGTTDIPPEFIIHSPPQFRVLLTQLCEQMWSEEYLPVENDTTKSIFLHKKGKTDTLDNYRTIATGCNLCKVYLRVICNRIQEGVENSHILGEIQNGFRAGRRSSDNILLMETIIRKYKRQNRALYIALLDITKAYDRVCRDSLWHKLQTYGFPKKMVANLQALYRNPQSTLTFQTVTTEPLQMKLGLRQGCVLSPILFALYIADLGRKLENSGMGVMLQGKMIPGVFFADDMVLWGQQKDLQALLKIIGDYAGEWKIEFSGAKSSVIPMSRPPQLGRGLWAIGKVPIVERENETIYIEEADEGRYLGVTICRLDNPSIYKPHFETSIKGAQRSSGFITHLLAKTHNPVTLLHKLWTTYAVPSFLYGAEVITWSIDTINKLELIQKSLIRNVFRLPTYTAVDALYAISNIRPLKTEITFRQLGYMGYVRNLPDDRWVKLAYLEQLTWAQEENLCNGELRDITPPVGNHKVYWLSDVITRAHALHIPIHNTYTKYDVKLIKKREDRVAITRGIEGHSTLRYLHKNYDKIDHMYHSGYHCWWQKARLEAMYLNHRYHTKNLVKQAKGQLCPVCNLQTETLEHFLCECSHNTVQPGWNLQGKDTEEQCNWLFSEDRTSLERSQISTHIKEIWDRRKKTIQETEERKLAARKAHGPRAKIQGHTPGPATKVNRRRSHRL